MTNGAFEPVCVFFAFKKIFKFHTWKSVCEADFASKK